MKLDCLNHSMVKKIEYPSITFGNLPGTRVGVCTMYSDGNWEITVDREYWNTASKESRIGLIFHELGHCILHRQHEEQYVVTQNNDQIPKSLMYPYNFYDIEYSDFWDYYSKELFSPGLKIIRNKTITIIN